MEEKIDRECKYCNKKELVKIKEGYRCTNETCGALNRVWVNQE